MFGFGNNRAKATAEGERYAHSMFVGLSGGDNGRLPDDVFADPYVAGFLQVLTTHAVATVYHFRMPDTPTINDILAECLDRLAPGAGAIARKTLQDVCSPTHPLYPIYLNGRHAGSEHVRTLFTSDGIARNEQHQLFRDHVKRRHL